jgi:hypothetical protein
MSLLDNSDDSYPPQRADTFDVAELGNRWSPVVDTETLWAGKCWV